MNINATLIAQFVVFFILAGFTMKFVWPPLMKALDERAKKIADGLAAADQGRAAMADAAKRVEIELAGARTEGQKRIAEAERRAQQSAEEIRKNAHAEAERIIAQAKADADQQVMAARDALRIQVAVLAVVGAEQILNREINPVVHADLLKQLTVEL